MYLRKILLFNQTLGMTLPKEYHEVLQLQRGEYVEVFLQDAETIIIKKHKAVPQKLRDTR